MELVQELQREDPDASIETILDKARHLALVQIFLEICDEKFITPFHIIENLYERSLTLEDVTTLMGWMGDINNEIRILVDSGSTAVMYKFCQSKSNDNSRRPGCWSRLRCTSNTKRKTQQPS